MDNANQPQQPNEVPYAPLPYNYSPSLAPISQNASLTMWIEQSDDLIEQLEHDLRGDAYNAEEDKWGRGDRPQLNDRGIRSVISIVRPIISKNTFLSNINEDDVFRVCKSTQRKAARLLFKNAEKFEIQTGHHETIQEIINNYVEFAVRRAMDQGEREFLSKSTQESRIIQPSQQQGGLWQIFKK